MHLARLLHYGGTHTALYAHTRPDEVVTLAPHSTRLASFVANGSVPAWQRVTDLPHEAPRDALPLEYRAIDLALPDRVVPQLKAAACDFWLDHGFYETRGLIN